MSALSTKILIVVTSHSTLGQTGKATGYYLPEVTHPFEALIEKGFSVDIASPQGGEAPLDPNSLDLKDPVNAAFWNNLEKRQLLLNTKSLKNIRATDYKAIVFAGGHGTMWDFADDANIQRITREIYEQNGIVAAVCHGPAALINVKLSDGKYLVAGKNVAGFSNAEEDAAELTSIMPFLLQTELEKKGAHYSQAGLWQKHVIVDGRLITGQNPASAKGVGEDVAKLAHTLFH